MRGFALSWWWTPVSQHSLHYWTSSPTRWIRACSMHVQCMHTQYKFIRTTVQLGHKIIEALLLTLVNSNFKDGGIKTGGFIVRARG